MLDPVFCTRIDGITATVVITVSGPLTSCDHVDALRRTLGDVPAGHSLVIELDAMTTVTASSLGCFRDMAEQAIRQGIHLVLVSESIDVRANLVLADLDSLAPVMDSLAHANRIIAAAA